MKANHYQENAKKLYVGNSSFNLSCLCQTVQSGTEIKNLLTANQISFVQTVQINYNVPTPVFLYLGNFVPPSILCSNSNVKNAYLVTSAYEAKEIVRDIIKIHK